MCCFSGPVAYVGSTSIFARLDGERQWLAYQMEVETVEAVAMVLPLPVPAVSPEDAVRFVDLSGYPKLFQDLRRAFPELLVAPSRSAGTVVMASQSTLRVHDVGDFEASFVPRPEDFGRLDPRFQLGGEVLRQLPQYADWGFAVFQLKQKPRGFFERWFGGAKSYRRAVHPMAFSFPTRDPQRVFFPTVHVHDGEVHPQARFDHTLYVQGTAEEGWETAAEPVASCVDLDRAGGVVIDAATHRRTLVGHLDNQDTWLVA